MLAISVELLHGTFRGDPAGTANTGNLAYGEWPPAPARLFAAFVAADGTGSRCRVTDGFELAWLERLPPPVIRADPSPSHQALRPRYVVRPERVNKSAHQEYVLRKGTKVRPGVRVAPRDPSITYQWSVESPTNVVEALRRRAARIGYLGAADSPVRVRVSTKMPESTEKSESTFVPHPEGDLAFGVPGEGDLGILDRMYEAWLAHGPDVNRAQFPALFHQVGYRSPCTDADMDRGEVVAWLRLARPISGRRVSTVTDLFKRAVLSRHEDIHGEPPRVLHGHGFQNKGFDLARYLALPDVGYPRSRGRIHGLALWLPPGAGVVAKSRARDAAHSIRRLIGRSIDVDVHPRLDETHPKAAAPRRWTRASRSWITAFPAVHERRVALDLEEVSRWCEHAGLPSPVAFRSTRCPLVPGGVDLAPTEVNRPGRPGLPYSHVQVWFETPVVGPVVLGSARQRGLGLCVDAPDGSVPRD